MKHMKHSLVALILYCSLLHGKPLFTLCIDGGGSKTLVQIADQNGNAIVFTHDGLQTDKAVGAGSNILICGEEALRTCFNTMFNDIRVGNDELVSLLPSCAVVAGIAGAASPVSKKQIEAVFESFGIAKEHIAVFSDAELNLSLVDDNNAMLIAGTGSICLGKKGQKLYRVGGLGKILGDEGSGYFIGREAVAAALAEEYGWGEKTYLTAPIKEFFKCTHLKEVIAPITRGEIKHDHIAKIAPLVFKHATTDQVACKIIERAAQHLGFLVTTMTKLMNMTEGEIHVWGGLFKSQDAPSFIHKIKDFALLPPALQLVNKAHENPALVFVQKFAASKQ